MSTDSSHSILIVDNDPNVVGALKARLGGLGYRCLGACCGAQALALFERDPADLVISDLNMPQGDGASLASALRRVSSVPIILISGFKDAYRKTLRGVPDVSFLHKPFETTELVSLVAASLAVAQAQPEREAARL